MAMVLRSGGEYRQHHVRYVGRMLAEHLPEHRIRVLSDVPVWPFRRLPLEHPWPGWWAKMEICRPDIQGPILFLDLDTVILRSLSPLLRDTSTSIACRDFLRGRRNPDALQSSLMLLTESDRALVWEAWTDKGPERWMREVSSDQIVIERALAGRVRFWQDTHPGAVVGYKTDLAKGQREPNRTARVVVFHGRPRPWDSGKAWAVEPFR